MFRQNKPNDNKNEVTIDVVDESKHAFIQKIEKLKPGYSYTFVVRCNIIAIQLKGFEK